MRAALLILLVASSASAQVSYPPSAIDAATVATQTDIATIAAQIPKPMLSTPPAEMVGGSAGSAGTYRTGNAVQPRITRTASCALASDGTCSTPWDTSSFPVGTTIRLTGAPAVVSSTAKQPITCIATSLTLDGIAFQCWVGQSTALTLPNVTQGLTLLPFISTGLTGSVVQVTAIPKS